MKYTNAVPVITTADVRSTVAYYTCVLGFAEHFIYGEPPVYAGVQRDGVMFYITEDIELADTFKKRGLHPDVFLWVEDVDQVFEEHKSRGAKIVEPIADRAWDARQYVIEDPNGYYIKVAEPIDENRALPLPNGRAEH